jgi:signal transduction histidine kinase
LQKEVTARERAEAEVRVALEAEKELNQLKSSFVSMVSHEFRTPLEVILSSSNILDRYLDRLAPDKRKAQLRAIRTSVHRMSDLMEDVLLLGRFEAGRLDCHPVLLDLEVFCRQLCADAEAGSDASRIRFTAGQLGEKAAADRTLLEHILANLLSNALKYSPAELPVEFTVTREAQNAVFVIRDSGCGIPAADHPRLFGAFYRGSNVGQTPGTGLGLVIVKRCVESHGGELRFDSIEGQGTTFTVILPTFAGTGFFRQRPNSATFNEGRALPGETPSSTPIP